MKDGKLDMCEAYDGALAFRKAVEEVANIAPQITLTTNLKRCCAKCPHSRYELLKEIETMSVEFTVLTCEHINVCKIIDQKDMYLFVNSDEF